MAVTWRTSGKVHPGRFTIETSDNPTLAWATGVLSFADSNVHRFMEDSKILAETMMDSRARVETGLMRHMADSLLHVRGNSYELNFGWWEGAPYYAPYQEFGTRNGIEPMMAVLKTFEEIRAQLPGAFAG